MQNIEDIIKEAEKCLNCKNPLCKKGCPIETSIPEFINEIKNKNLKKAYEILQANNTMSDICSTVCPYEEFCSGHCIKGIKGEPVNISFLEKYVNFWARENNIRYEYKKENSNGMKVAIIGSGPAGLSCAIELAKKGFNVTIFEKEAKIGGLLTYGIPGFRLPREITKNLTNIIKKLEIEIKVNTELGKDIKINDLKEKGYKAIFVAIGAEIASTYSLSEENCNNLYKSDFILRKYNNKEKVDNLGNVIIIGGGNVATDSARASLRMGAKSATIVYRRSQKEMPAREIELQDAIKDGVKVIYNARVIKAKLENKIIKEIKCIQTVTKDGKVVDIEDSDFTIKADSIVFAIGLKPNEQILQNEKIEIENGLIKTDETLKTNIKGVFAGGDAIKNKSTVCNAIKDGKIAAKNIEKFIIIDDSKLI